MSGMEMDWLEHFALPDAADRTLLSRAARLKGEATVHDLTRPILQQVAQSVGIDFATALLYERLCREDATRAALCTALSPREPSTLPRNVLVGVVPGAFYREYSFTGADGQRVLDAARRAGIRAERVPLASFGSLKENARTLGNWLARHPADEICLVSLSKGSADVQFALTESDAAQRFRNVSVWVNLSGIVQGTALADWLLRQRWRRLLVRVFAWWRGYPFDVLRDLQRDGNPRLESAFDWPAHLRVFHVIGFPLRRHLSSPWARRAHQRLEPWGPTDGGGILLADAVRWPGTLVPLWGADHYLRPEVGDVGSLVLRLLACDRPVDAVATSSAL